MVRTHRDLGGTIWCQCGQSEVNTMFELVQALNDGAEELKRRSRNPISLNAGCELFIAFVTLFPHESDVSTSATDSPYRPSMLTSSTEELCGTEEGAGTARPKIRAGGYIVPR